MPSLVRPSRPAAFSSPGTAHGTRDKYDARLHVNSGVHLTSTRRVARYLVVSEIDRERRYRPWRPQGEARCASRGHSAAFSARSSQQPHKNDARADVNSALHPTSTRRIARYLGGCPGRALNGVKILSGAEVDRERRHHTKRAQPRGVPLAAIQRRSRRWDPAGVAQERRSPPY